jgi:hypothetical protein
MSEVKMKTMVVSWCENVYYRTVIEVPEDFNDAEVEQAFWQMDLSDEKPVDTEYARVDYIDRVTEE